MNSKDDLFLINRIKELANNAFYKNIQTNTVFLNLYEQTVFNSTISSLPNINIFQIGGYDMAERKIVCFLPYYEDNIDNSILSYIKIEPVNMKFSKKLSHRDFLGSLMNIGIERHMIGDIICKDNIAYIIALSSVKDIIIESIEYVSNTKVKSKIIDKDELILNNNFKNTDVNVASLRLDAIIAAVYNISRTKVTEYFQENKVFLNSSFTTNKSYFIHENDIISVRGFGKFRFNSQSKITKKGRLIVNIDIYD